MMSHFRDLTYRALLLATPETPFSGDASPSSLALDRASLSLPLPVVQDETAPSIRAKEINDNNSSKQFTAFNGQTV